MVGSKQKSGVNPSSKKKGSFKVSKPGKKFINSKAAAKDKSFSIVKADKLNWKSVEIPDTLDDFEGFYGLEEIDGVDVKVVNGNVQFLVKDEEKLADETKETTANDDEDDNGQGDDSDHFDDDEVLNVNISDSEFDVKDGDGDGDKQMEDVSKDKSDKKSKKQNKNDKKEKALNLKQEKSKEKKDKERAGANNELLSNTFNQVNEALLIDDNEVDLPNWTNDSKGLSLSSYTLSALASMKFESPTPIQKKAIPLAMEGKDVIGKATTGSGKTLAYGIPILEKYLENMPKYNQNKKEKKINAPAGIIFAPTRELAHQVVEHLNNLAKFSPLTQHGILNITGGLSIQKQERLLAHGPGIIVATPGRLLELLHKDEELVKRLAATDMIVLDEADRLLQDGHFDEFEKILELLTKNRHSSKTLEWKWQTLVFSATFSRDLFGKLDNKFRKNKPQASGALADNDEILQLLAQKLKFKDPKPSLVDANPKEVVAGLITEAIIECGPIERDLYLYYFLLMYPGSTLVFANSIDSVKRLGPLLTNLGIPSFSINSMMIQKQRLRSLERFKAASENNRQSVLIASDVAARGLDIPNVSHVVHYHLPRSADVYVHRSGRTARAGKEGVSVMLCSPQEASGPLKKLRKVVANSQKEKFSKLNAKSDVKSLPVEMSVIAQLRERVNIASKLADSEISTSSTQKDKNWMKQAAEDLGIEDLSDMEEDDIIKKQRKRKEHKTLDKNESRYLRAQLRDLISQPIRKDLRKNYLTGGLQNLAHQLVTGSTHKSIVGHEKVNALDDLKNKRKDGTRKKVKKEVAK